MALKIDPVTGKMVSDESLPETVPPVVGTETVPDTTPLSFVANPDIQGGIILDNLGDEPKVDELAKSNQELAKQHGIDLDSLPTVPVRERSEEQRTIQDELAAILEEYGGLESNIPVGHKYWNLLNAWRANQNKF
jgi:hypothetical protein